MNEVKVDESGDVIAELIDIEKRWMRQQYVDFATRQRVLRYALLGAALERTAQRVRGPVSDAILNHAQSIDQRFNEGGRSCDTES